MDSRRAVWNDQRGVALPMAMLALLILSALVIGFSVLSASEPTIASNQLMVAQARSLAEAGVERAMWALNRGLSDPNDPLAISSSLTGTAAAPYDGSQLLTTAVNGNVLGGFRVTVAKGASSFERTITAVGWVPNDTTNNSKAHQRIRVTVVNPRLAFDPPAALAVRGELQAGGNSLVDSRADQSCGKKMGTVTTGTTTLQGNAADIYGATDNNNTANEITDANNGTPSSSSGDVVKNASTSWFDQYILTDADMNALRAYAKSYGTYLQGSVTFNASNKISNGLVFIDTISGTNITGSSSSSDFASVAIHGNPPADPSGVFSGWLIVNGSLSIDGNFAMHGLVYAQNDISYHGVGTGGVYGAVMSRNIRDLSSTSIDSDLLGNALINYNCAYARNGGGTPPKWSVEKGTYKECDDYSALCS